MTSLARKKIKTCTKLVQKSIELNQMVVIIKGYTYLLKNPVVSSNKNHKHSNHCKNQPKHALLLYNNEVSFISHMSGICQYFPIFSAFFVKTCTRLVQKRGKE